jgi:hypothetical protein
LAADCYTDFVSTYNNFVICRGTVTTLMYKMLFRLTYAWYFFIMNQLTFPANWTPLLIHVDSLVNFGQHNELSLFVFITSMYFSELIPRNWIDEWTAIFSNSFFDLLDTFPLHILKFYSKLFKGEDFFSGV